MKDHIDNFIYFMKVERGVSTNTVQAYITDLNKLKNFLKRIKKDVTKVGRDDLVDFLMYLKDTELSATTIARNLAAIKTFWKFLAAEQVIKENVASTVETPKTWKHIPEVLNKKEVKNR